MADCAHCGFHGGTAGCPKCKDKRPQSEDTPRSLMTAALAILDARQHFGGYNAYADVARAKRLIRRALELTDMEMNCHKTTTSSMFNTPAAHACIYFASIKGSGHRPAKGQ